VNYPSGKTHIYMLLADPVTHVRAAQFINPILERKGIDAFLIPVHVRAADLADVVPRLAKIGNLKGIIATIPHKESLARICVELGPNARMIGAVNTVRIEAGGRLVGEMFDGDGLVASAQTSGIPYRERRVLIAGSGGSARAIAFALVAGGVAALAVTNRTTARATKLVEDLHTHYPKADLRVAAPDASGFDLVVNCTSLGLHAGDASPIDIATLSAKTDVIDIIAVRETELMQAATAKGCRVVGGRPMAELQLDAQVAFFGSPPKLPI
jgi:shikimate dehydrogenase